VRSRRPLALALCSAALAAGAASARGAGVAVPAWPAPSDAMHRTVLAGLTPLRSESLVHHVHAHLDIFFNGKKVRVPAAIGIDIQNPKVKTFPMSDGTTAYGGITICGKPCISPLHTHDDTGIIHTESPSPVPNRLGELFVEWDVALTRTCVGTYCHLARTHVYVNGTPFTGDPRTITLTDHKEIAIVIGTPPKKIPATANFANA
jgi:hypothetical protein